MPAPSSAPHPARMRPSPALPWEQWRHKGKDKSLDWDRKKGKKTSPKVDGRGDNSCTRQGSSAGGASDSAKWFSWGGGSPPGPLQASGQPEVQAEDKRAVQHWGGERTPRLLSVCLGEPRNSGKADQQQPLPEKFQHNQGACSGDQHR